MSAESLINQHLDTWTQAIETKSTAGRGSSNKLNLVGIQKLRELILEMAVRGLLVPQDSNDEPASVLLERIDAEKAQLIKDGKIKKAKTLPEIREDEKPFDLPNGWELARLNEIGDWGAGATPKRGNSEYYNGNIPWFKSGELIADFISETEEKITEKALKECSLRLNQPGDVLIAMYGATIGKTSILEVEGTTNQAVCACTTFSGVLNRFLLLLLKAYKSRFTNMGAGGAQPNISKVKIVATVIALPPFEEQKRIVAKVDELMVLCDQLESQTLDSIATHQTLVETLLGNLVNPDNTANFDQAWSLIAQNFDVLFTTEHSVDTLKQTILQLAVMGKLVSQNPNEEPASELLKKIAAEKAQLIADKKIKKSKPIPEITESEKPFDLPYGWELTRLKDLVSILGDGLHGTPNYDDKGDYFFVNGNNLIAEAIQIKLDTKKVNKEEFEKHKKPLSDRTVFVSINGTLGRVGFYAGEKIMLGKSACYFNLLSGIDKFFISKVLQAPYFQDYAVASATGSTIKNLSLKVMNHLVVYLPPKEEQTRIVTKVNELMTLCDELKTQLQTAQQTQINLAQSIAQETLK